MASLNSDKTGNRRIQFRAPNGRRATLYLGKLPRRQCETVKSYVERLLIAAASGDNIDTDTAAWLTKITDELHGKLAAVGLVTQRVETTISELLNDFVTANSHAKPATLVVWGQVANCLKQYLGKDCPLKSVGRNEAEGFRQWLVSQGPAKKGLAATTVTKRLQFARQFFAYAVRREWIDRNPFEGVSHKGGNPRDRQYYVTEEKMQRLIGAAPNWVWRTIIALARYGGLRTPSEVLSLQLADMDWEHGAMTVTAPKTEGHGQGRRIVPMFDRLRPFLNEAWEMAREGQTNVIPENLYLPAAKGPRGWNGCNLRTTFEKIVRRAGLEPWPRPFHALRASCESDLAREYPITTVCRWIGNTVAIAARHYVQVTDEDFRRAASVANEATYNPTYPAPVRGGISSSKKGERPRFSEKNEALRTCTYDQVEDRGLEPLTSTMPLSRSPN